MSLLLVLALLSVAILIAFAVPVDLVRRGRELEAEDWGEDEDP